MTRKEIVEYVEKVGIPKKVEVFENGSFRKHDCNVALAFKRAAEASKSK